MPIGSNLYIGATQRLDGAGNGEALRVPAHHLLTHGVVVGMTGSGKTGLMTVFLEEALRNAIPVLAIDVKGDLPNLLLALPSFAPALMVPWAGAMAAPNDARTEDEIASALATERQRGLNAWGITEADLASFRAGTRVRIITPGSTAGEP